MERTKQELRALLQLRDELKLKAHLARADARDLRERLETWWPRIEHRLHELEHETGAAKDRVLAATRALFDELHDGYRELERHDHHH